MSDQATISLQHRSLCCAGLPLAVYREVAAHLEQVTGVHTQLVAADQPQFDYQHSQVGYLGMTYPVDLSAADQARVQQILDFYSDRYGPWVNLDQPSSPVNPS